MVLSEKDALWASEKFIEYFKNFNRIDDYFRARKIERVKNIPPPLPGFSIEDSLFQSFDLHPVDMNFKVEQIENKLFDKLLEKTASFSPDPNPGKMLKLVVKETTTNTIVGFIRFGSPLINSKPRNDYLGGVPDLGIFNNRAIMGFNIVPAQPFGYNYLGGKLLAGICCSHASRRMLNEKYGTDFCLFETTSLYGNIKGASMYDGMRPFLRYKGDTQSKFLLTLGEDIYGELKDWFTKKNDKEFEDEETHSVLPGQDAPPPKQKELIKKSASSRKLKIQTKMIGIVKSSLKEYNSEAYENFIEIMSTATGVTTQKRFYMSEYGFSNAKEVLLGKTDKLVKTVNYDRFELENVVAWWKKKATKRYDNVVADGRIRKNLEVWNKDSMNEIDIIR
jgi:hypothetical protein